MSDFPGGFAGIYRSGSRMMRSASDDEAWSRDYDALLDRHDAVFIYSTPRTCRGRKRANRFRFGSIRAATCWPKVSLALYVVTNEAQRALTAERSARTAKVVLSDCLRGFFEEVEQRAVQALMAQP